MLYIYSMIVTSSLAQSYATLVTALAARGADNLSLSFIQQALVNEKLKLSEDSKCILTNDQYILWWTNWTFLTRLSAT